MAGHNLFKASFRIARGLLLASLILLLAGCAGFDAVKDSSGKETSQAITLPYEQSGSDPTGADPTGERQKVPVPVITAPDAIECVVLEGDAASFFDPLQNVSATDENGKSYPVASEGDYDLAKAGEYVLTFSAAADDGSKVTRTAVLTVVSPFDADGNMLDGVYKTARGYELVIENGIATVDGYMIVNKSYTVPKGFSSTGDGSRDMRKEAMEAWYAMRAAAPDNIKQNLKIKSGVRNISDQTIIFNNYVKNRGLENALTFSAKPRHSEHHTGLAMDITVSGRTDAAKPENAAVMEWLNENAWKFGYIQRYPENKTNETGYIYESWHYRFVGKELAEILYNNGDWITMEDYFGVDSAYRD